MERVAEIHGADVDDDLRGNRERQADQVDLAQAVVHDAAQLDAGGLAGDVDGHRDLDPLLQVDRLEICVQVPAAHRVALKLAHEHRLATDRPAALQLDQRVHAGFAVLEQVPERPGVDVDRDGLLALGVADGRDAAGRT